MSCTGPSTRLGRYKTGTFYDTRVPYDDFTATSPPRTKHLLQDALPSDKLCTNGSTTMNPADYDEVTLDAMEFHLVNHVNVSYVTTNETIESMLGIPGLPEAIELSTQ